MTTTSNGEAGKTRDGNIRVGRRVFLGMSVLGLGGIVFEGPFNSVLQLIPWWPGFRIYSITGSYPLSDSDYRLEVSGLVNNPTVFTLSDLKAMPTVIFPGIPVCHRMDRPQRAMGRREDSPRSCPVPGCKQAPWL